MEKPQEKPFTTENLTTVIKEKKKIAEQTIGDSEYAHSKVPGWNSTIIDGCLKKLKEKSSNHKYVVTCIVMQKKGAGFYAGTSVYWDNNNDVSASYRYENKTLYAVVNVFVLSL
ncbi:Tctex-1 [Rhizopus microsporus ATCC 52813]|uniref:Tctex-1 n=1 Tax=Rhizopus microsporus ATCC 52813 TaxID=1340429 RepID=A0A2G4SJ22_RHIZD|nr:Tctex-1 [Rhizopus microsporus ATCC 52813]PHZ08761.1 Tctex-1 [Rhizopus microsporus ATCC 52813]